MRKVNWKKRDFVAAFANLSVPITTANEQLVENWQAEEVWKPYWSTIKEFFYSDDFCHQVIHLVMSSARACSTLDQRIQLKEFVKQNIPNYTAIFSSEILPAINYCLQLENSNERILGFQYGKDGRGALPDRYYQLLLKNKFLVVGNHHDLLGHFILFCDPIIRCKTEKLATHFSLALEFEHYCSLQYLNSDLFRQKSLFLRRALRLYTLAWNLIQEKLYIKILDHSGKEKLNLVGAFNSVYNPIFSDRLSRDKVKEVAGALGFFNRDPMQSILLSPEFLIEYCTEPKQSIHQGNHLSEDFNEITGSAAKLSEALNHYARIWNEIGFSKDLNTADLCLRFEDIVSKTLLDRKSFFPRSFDRRWQDFSDRVLQDKDFYLVFDKDSLLKLAESMVDVANQLVQRERFSLLQ